MFIYILNGKEEGKCIKLKPGQYTIGRSPEVDIVISDDYYVSGKHAELKYLENEKLSITDLGSKNGTYILGEEVESQKEIKIGDIFRVGHTYLKISRRTPERFYLEGEEQSSAPEAIVVVDIVGSSKIAQAMGDRVASKVKNVLFKTLNNNLVKYPAEFLKNTGDGFMLVFSKPLEAIRFSIDLMKDTRGDGLYKGFHIRIGIHYGETYILPDGDRRGMTVDMAFRVESVKISDMHQTVMGIKKEMLPRVDRIFISEVVHGLISSHSSIKTRCIGFFDLKGLTGRHKIFEVIY